MRSCGSIALLLVISAQSFATELKIRRDLSYTTPADDSRRLDVYSPVEGKDHPVLVWIHGGGWRQGDKSAVQHKPQAFAEQGFVLVSVNYRFVPQVTVQEMAGDIAQAIKWVHDQAENYGGSPNKIVVAGHSAGAHLAALVCTDDSYLTAAGLSLSHVKGCIPVDTAAYDIPSRMQSAGRLGAGAYRSPFGESEASQKQLSPIKHVAPGKGIPSFLILHVADRPDSTAQSQAFAKALTAADVSAKVCPGRNKTHATINRDLGLPNDEPTKEVFRFLDELLPDR